MDIKQVPPAAVRNTPPILEVLTRLLPAEQVRTGLILEIAAGSGYHAAAFARALPHFVWQPTDADAAARASIAAYVAEAGLANLRPPLALAVCEAPWPMTAADAIVCINMIHISPWTATVGLFKGAAGVLQKDGLLVTYGPYAVRGDFISESNIAFDQSLRARNPAWGVREVGDVTAVAATHGFRHAETVTMPANNLTLVFRKTD